MIVTDDGMMYLLKPKEEENPVVKNLKDEIGDTIVEGAKVHENVVIILTTSKKVFIVENLNEFTVRILCNKPYSIFIL